MGVGEYGGEREQVKRERERSDRITSSGKSDETFDSRFSWVSFPSLEYWMGNSFRREVVMKSLERWRERTGERVQPAYLQLQLKMDKGKMQDAD